MSMLNEWHIHFCDCTWLNVFSHALSLLIKHKKIFVCFSFFIKVLCFYKNCQNFKNSVALFWRLSRRLVQLHASIVSPLRDFLRLNGGSMSQSWKILRIFFKIWDFNVSRGSVWRLFCRWRFQSRGYSKIFAAYLATPSRVELPIAKNT